MPKRRKSVTSSDSESDYLTRKRRRLLKKLNRLDRKIQKHNSSETSESEIEEVILSNEESIANTGHLQEVQVQVHRENDPNELNEPSSARTPAVSTDILEILGDEPVGDETVFGKDVEQAIADRWKKYLTLGIEKTEKESLKKKYLIPKNLELLQAPLLNQEISASLNEADKKEDKYVCTIQNQLGNGLAALAIGIDRLLVNNTPKDEIKTNVLPCIIEAGKIFCDVFHMLSTNRKYHIESQLNSVVKKIVRESKPDTLLCGKDFPEKFKEVKNQMRTGKELKSANNIGGRSFIRGASTYQGAQNVRKSNNLTSLNYRGRYHKNRMKKPGPVIEPRTSQSQSSKRAYQKRIPYVLTTSNSKFKTLCWKIKIFL